MTLLKRGICQISVQLYKIIGWHVSEYIKPSYIFITTNLCSSGNYRNMYLNQEHDYLEILVYSIALQFRTICLMVHVGWVVVLSLMDLMQIDWTRYISSLVCSGYPGFVLSMQYIKYTGQHGTSTCLGSGTPLMCK